jgi:hypothetical protein
MSCPTLLGSRYWDVSISGGWADRAVLVYLLQHSQKDDRIQ